MSLNDYDADALINKDINTCEPSGNLVLHSFHSSLPYSWPFGYFFFVVRPLLFGHGSGPITPPGPAMVVIDRKDLKKITPPLPGAYTSVSASRGHVFRRYPLNGPIDQNETKAQGDSACDLTFRNILLSRKIKILGSCHWLVMLSMEPALFRRRSSRAKVTDVSRDLGCDPRSIHQPCQPYQTGALASVEGDTYERVAYCIMSQIFTLRANGRAMQF